MNKKTVMTLIRWQQTETRRLHYSNEVVTVKNFFTRAYLVYFGETDGESNARIHNDEINFLRQGRIPLYVATFIKKVLYPHRLKSSGRPASASARIVRQ